ncbi:MAG: ATP-grasp domain-containing protein [Promethearchaeota archaeon]
MLKSNIIIFGASSLQERIIRVASLKGFFTIVIDPDKYAPARNNADIFEVVNGKDYEKTLYLAKKYSVKGLVTAATDKPLLMMARIAKALNLSFPEYESVFNTTRKDKLKEILKKNGIPCAEGFLIDENSDINNLPFDMKFPLIVKPVDNSGSRGVTLNFSIEDVIYSIKYAMKFSQTKKVLIEEYIEGPEFSVDSITFNKKTSIIQITDKITTDFPYKVEIGHTQPTYLEKEKIREINDIVIEMIRALSLDNCACHTELKLTPKGPVIIENGARLGGDFITSVLVPISTGVDMEAAVIDIATRNIPNLRIKKNKAVAIRYLEFKEGIVKEIKDIKEMYNLPYLVDINLSLKIGDKIKQITNSLNRYGHIIVKGDTREIVLRNVANCLNLLKEKVIIK